MQIAIELPNDFVAFQAAPTLRSEISASYALWLFQQERVTLAKAAELASMSLYDFMIFCKNNGVAVIGISPEELRDEFESFDAA